MSPSIDAILILGHRLEPDGSPSEDLIRRIDCAVARWKETNAPLIMPCGGITMGHSRTEASVMKEMLIARGVPEEIIQLEDRSRITFENIRNAKALLGDGKHAALITSDYHLERALDECRRAGLDVDGISAPTPEGTYREQKFAEEKRFYDALREKRESGMSEAEIIHWTIHG